MDEAHGSIRGKVIISAIYMDEGGCFPKFRPLFLAGCRYNTVLDNTYQAIHLSGTFQHDGTWQTSYGDGYVYRMNEVTVSDGATVTVEPGSIFKSSAGYLTVNGTLIASGTSVEPIVFTSWKDDTWLGDTNADGIESEPVPGDWKSISITNSANDWSYVEAYYGGRYSTSTNYCSYGYYSVLKIYGSSPTLTNCTFSQNHCRGIYLSNSDATLSSCTVSHSNSDGIYLEGNSSPTITECSIHDNDGWGIYLSGSTSVNQSGNTFADNGSGDIGP